MKKQHLLDKYHALFVSHGNCINEKLFSAMEGKQIQADIFAGHFTSPVIGFRSEIFNIERNECIPGSNFRNLLFNIGVRVGDSDASFSKIDDLKVFETFLEGVTCSTPSPKMRSRVFADELLRLGV
ncbi:hypothetical protein LOAG_00318 [Loa loa]|uniref:Uncharacterized protein n=1 Tax=Loa loa TaxID=7209 RepID=A0A1S0UBR9_LOALO|nr:hypothetical protein LOAG_00318 [Loa loa]EFO28157.1 hypothetical protein LOAG_00318 [Loa loa]